MVVEFCIGPKGGAECLLAQYMPSVKTMAFLAHVNTQSISRLQIFFGGGVSYSVPCVWVLLSDVSVRPRFKRSAIADEVGNAGKEQGC